MSEKSSVTQIASLVPKALTPDTAPAPPLKKYLTRGRRNVSMLKN